MDLLNICVCVFSERQAGEGRLKEREVSPSSSFIPNIAAAIRTSTGPTQEPGTHSMFLTRVSESEQFEPPSWTHRVWPSGTKTRVETCYRTHYSQIWLRNLEHGLNHQAVCSPVIFQIIFSELEFFVLRPFEHFHASKGDRILSLSKLRRPGKLKVSWAYVPFNQRICSKDDPALERSEWQSCDCVPFCRIGTV